MDAHFARTSKVQFRKVLRSRNLEDVEMIDLIDRWFQELRGYSFRMPPKNGSVILLFSGGLDTVVMLDILLRVYGLQVFPLFVNRGQHRFDKEKRSAQYFERYFFKRFSKLQKLKILTSYEPPIEIRSYITNNSELKLISKKSKQRAGNPLLLHHLSANALHYSIYLLIKYKIDIKTIICGMMPTDGLLFSYETLTAVRSITQTMILQTKDTLLQFASLAFEPELGHVWNKKDLMVYADKYDIPIELSWSCLHKNVFHCGVCIACQSRKREFKAAGLYDHTIYHDMRKKMLVFEIARRLTKGIPIW